MQIGTIAVVSNEIQHFRIVENGMGISKAHNHRIFDMCYRTDEHSQGTGIGPFLVKEPVKMLRDRISVKSNVGKWAMFSMNLQFVKGVVTIPESHIVVL
jgi:signal transduction histidine kinase